MTLSLRPLEFAQLERLWDFRVAHEPSPHVAAAKVIGAEQSDAKIDSQNIGIDPSRGGSASVAESVTSPNQVAPTLLHRLEGGNTNVRREHQGPARGARNHGSINRAAAMRSTPGHVSSGAVRSRDTPHVLRVASRKLLGQIQTESAMRSGCDNRILEVIDARRRSVANPAHIDPRLRGLLREERRRTVHVLIPPVG